MKKQMRRAGHPGVFVRSLHWPILQAACYGVRIGAIGIGSVRKFGDYSLAAFFDDDRAQLGLAFARWHDAA